MSMTVNGDEHTGDVEPRLLLTDFIRRQCGLTGTHVGCEQGACGACTILVNGRPVRACLMFAVQAAGKSITTVEGLNTPTGELTPLQAMMRKNHALQCGFCTPGILITATGLLDEHGSDLTQEQVVEALDGHFCRCTGYTGIATAVLEAAQATLPAKDV